jgi:hypothetical protein
MSESVRTISRSFAVAVTAAASLFLGCCMVVAARQWFVGDDFAFLWLAQQPRNWGEVFLPLGPRLWWSYRPLTTDVFFSVCLWLFHYDPFGYLAVSLALHFLTGFVVYRLARQCGFDARVAMVTALLSVSRFPFLSEGFWISDAQYTITMFFYTACVTLVMDYAQSSRRSLQLAACVALVLTLLSNEMGASLGGVVVLLSWYADGFGLSLRGLRRTFGRVLPLLVIAAAYLVLRTQVIGPTQVPSGYGWSVGWHMLVNSGLGLFFVLGNQWAYSVGALLLVVAGFVAVSSRGRAPRGSLRSLLAVSAVALGWIALGLLPYVGLRVTHPRFAMPIQIPACLLLGAFVNALSKTVSAKHPTVVELGLLTLLVLSVPYRVLWEQASAAKGASAKQLVELISKRSADLPIGSTVVVRYGGEGLCGAAEADEFRARIFGGAALPAFFDPKRLGLYLVDVSQPPPGYVHCPPCMFLDLKPGLVVTAAEPAPPADAVP